ncbi:MAG TPA: PAS domain S-box protein [Prolixibacteraceae bacterium]|nr:PAS domain S-box protein [Prolixibacteraceae bacterium]
MKKPNKTGEFRLTLRKETEKLQELTSAEPGSTTLEKDPQKLAEENREIILQTAMDGFLMVDMHGKILEVNETYCRMSGFDKQELLKMHISWLGTEESAAETITHIEKVISNGEDRFETRHRRKDGSIFDVEISVQYQPFSGGRLVAFLHDITHRKKIQEDLLESEHRYRTLFDQSNDALFLLDLESGRYIDCNQLAVTLTGYSREEILALKIGAFLPPQRKQESFSNIELIISRKTLRKETEIITKSGQLIPVEFNSSAVEINKKKCILSMLHDISDRKEAEEKLIRLNAELEDRIIERTDELVKSNLALQEAEEKYRNVADFTYNWETWLGPEDKYIYVSPSCEQISGYSVDEFMDDSTLYFKIVHPDDRKRVERHFLDTLKGNISDIDFDFRIITRNGEEKWISHCCRSVYNKEGQWLGQRGSNQDITARKEIEEQLKISNQKYELLSENISDGIFILKNGRLEYCNYALTQIFGYGNNELEGMELIQMLLPDSREELQNFLLLNFPNNQSRNFEVECFKKDNSVIYVEILLNYVADQHRIYGVIHDITEKKQVQQNIVKAIVQTEENERAYFSKELHDGLGPLLSTIKLYLQWSVRPKTNKSREEIVLNAEALLEDALNTVKEISNKLSPHILTYYGLTPAVESFIKKLDETSTTKIVFLSKVNRRIDLKIESTIYRALIECINNSLKHSQAGNIFIMIDDTGSQFHVQYKDDGIGYDPAEIFSANKGMGLFNLQNRFQSIGGKITLFSKPGHGVNYQMIINV